jgi:hypothetical protein
VNAFELEQHLRQHPDPDQRGYRDADAHACASPLQRDLFLCLVEQRERMEPLSATWTRALSC